MSIEEDRFAVWFRKNYPGPDTIIHKPDWHAPKIFQAATQGMQAEIDRLTAALETARADALREAVDRIKTKIDKDQPKLTKWGQELSSAKKPSVKYSILRAAMDARISDRDTILALIKAGGDA